MYVVQTLSKEDVGMFDPFEEAVKAGVSPTHFTNYTYMCVV